MVKMQLPFLRSLGKVAKICVATIGDAFFVRSVWGALFVFSSLFTFSCVCAIIIVFSKEVEDVVWVF